jgi:hypothetical protein
MTTPSERVKDTQRLLALGMGAMGEHMKNPQERQWIEPGFLSAVILASRLMLNNLKPDDEAA